jgi:hypothetical protein
MRYEVTTGLMSHEALELATTYFGRGGARLSAITVHPGATTTLKLETREWDAAVQRFMGQVSHRSRWWSRWWRRKRSAAPPAPVFPLINNAPEDGADR